MIKQGSGVDQTAVTLQSAREEVIVVQHWVEELRRLVQTR
jgi:hypothetical protein